MISKALKFLVLVTSVGVGCFVACGALKPKEDKDSEQGVPYYFPPPSQESPNVNMSFHSSTLRVLPTDYIRDGWVTYKFHVSGKIEYWGVVSYRMCVTCNVQEQSFNGSYQAKNSSVFASTYMPGLEEYQDYKVQITPIEATESVSKVDVSVLDDDSVSGFIEVGTTGFFADIQYAEIQGEVLGLTIKVILKK